MMMMMMMMCFWSMIDRRKAFSVISSRDHCQRSSSSRISNTSWARFEPAQNLSSGFVQWSCAVVIATTPSIYLSNNNFCYQKNRQRLQEEARNLYVQEGGKEKVKQYYKNNKERLQKEARNTIESYVMKKRIEKECGKNWHRNMSEYRKNILRKKLKSYIFCFISSTSSYMNTPMGQ